MPTIKAESVRKTESAPKSYQIYIKKETAWIKKKVKHTHSLIDVGCGEGRATHFLSKLTDNYVGVDLDSKAITKAKKLQYKKVKFQVMDVTKLSNHFPAGAFEVSVCLWNTIGNIEDDLKALQEMNAITAERCFVSTLKKGNLNERINYYNTYGIEFNVEKASETIYSKAWGIARAYTKEQLKELCRKAGFKVVKTTDLGKIAFGLELRK